MWNFRPPGFYLPAGAIMPGCFFAGLLCSGETWLFSLPVAAWPWMPVDLLAPSCVLTRQVCAAKHRKTFFPLSAHLENFASSGQQNLCTIKYHVKVKQNARILYFISVYFMVYVHENTLKGLTLYSPASASQTLRLKVCTTIPSSFLDLYCTLFFF